MEATSEVDISAVAISEAVTLAADILEDGISEALAVDTSGAAILVADTSVADTSAADTSEAGILAAEVTAMRGAIISADRISRVDIVASETAASRTGIFVATAGISQATAARLQQPDV